MDNKESYTSLNPREGIKVLMNTQWVKKNCMYELDHYDIHVKIEKDALSANESHWIASIDSIEARTFPRRYMSIETAKQEVKSAMLWMLYSFASHESWNKAK